MNRIKVNYLEENKYENGKFNKNENKLELRSIFGIRVCFCLFFYSKEKFVTTYTYHLSEWPTIIEIS